MPKGKSLTDEERKEIYEARMLGESREEIARAYGIATASVTAIVRRYRQKETGMAGKECVVAGNKKSGRLMSTLDPHRYEGTYVIGGKSFSKAFSAEGASEAARMWRDWCHELAEKHRRPKAEQPKPQGRPVPPQGMQEPEKKEPQAKEPQVKEQPMGDSVYIIWAKGDSPRLFGAYRSMEAALKEVDNLNEVAKFLVNDRVFEVEELALKS